MSEIYKSETRKNELDGPALLLSLTYSHRKEWPTTSTQIFKGILKNTTTGIALEYLSSSSGRHKDLNIILSVMADSVDIKLESEEVTE